MGSWSRQSFADFVRLRKRRGQTSRNARFLTSRQFQKANVLARVVSVGDLASEPAYIVEFSMRSGARFQYYFSVKTSLITKITGDIKKTRSSV